MRTTAFYVREKINFSQARKKRSFCQKSRKVPKKHEKIKNLEIVKKLKKTIANKNYHFAQVIVSEISQKMAHASQRYDRRGGGQTNKYIYIQPYISSLVDSN